VTLSGLAKITYSELMSGSDKFKGVYMAQDDGTTDSVPVRVMNSVSSKKMVSDKWEERCDGDSYEGEGYVFCR
jgi:hypothetical protein